MTDETHESGSPNDAADEPLDAAAIEAECELLEKRVRLDHLAPVEDIEAFRPGGTRNPSRNAKAYLRYYGSLRAWVGGPSVTWPLKDPVVAAAERAAHETEVISALGDQPETVFLIESPLTPDDQPHYVTVHPKGWDATTWLACADRRIEYLCEQRAKYEGTPDDTELLERITAELQWLYKLITWAVSTPTAFLPFEPLAIDDSELPEWIGAIHPLDLARIHAAFLRVQAVRLASLKLLLSVKTGAANQTRPSWVTLFTNLSEAKQIPTNLLMRDHSLPRLMAQAVVAADQKAQAIEQALKQSAKTA